MVSGQIWEVVSGKGVLVRVARDLGSPAFEDRLSAGSLVQEVEVAGNRLRYNRIAGTGYGPDSGWVSIRADRQDLLAPAVLEPPKGGWRVLEKELPQDWERPPPPPPPAEPLALPAPPAAAAGKAEVKAEAGPGSVVAPQGPQVPGQPYVYHRQVWFADTKPTGLRMSACLAAMDECRTDMFCICDMTVESFRKVTNPFTQVCIEMRPGVAKLGRDASPDGLLYTHQDSQGAVLSWLRMEMQSGWPMFPLRSEEQHAFLLGKQKDSGQKVPIATARLVECFVDDSQHPPSPLQGPNWEQDAERFWARAKRDHSSEALNERQLHKLYPAADKPFVATQCKRVSWLMSHSFGDLWSLLYHAKAPEVIWEVNKLAGGAFAALLDGEPDPQAMAVNLPKKMEVGTVYDAYCFLEESGKKGLYVLLPEGSKSAQDCALAVCASYSWDTAPADGRSLRAEDVEVLLAGPRNTLVAFALGGDAPKPTRLLDLSKVVRL